MTITVARPRRPTQISLEALETLEAELAETMNGVEGWPHMLGSMLNDAVLTVRARLDLDPAAARLETWQAVVAAMQIGSAIFATTVSAGGTVECRINHEMRTLPATGPRYYAHAGNWLTAFWFAIVCRDQARMTQLCEVPPDSMRGGEVTHDEYVYAWIDTLQTYWLERPGLVEKLSSTIDLSYPDVATIAPRDLLQFVLYSPVNLFYLFIRRNGDGFNEGLLSALENHKAYWTASDDRAKDISGSLALGPLAVACLAYDAGYDLNVESDYLPEHLLHRDWLGEFAT
jgi:hypothetical protein